MVYTIISPSSSYFVSTFGTDSCSPRDEQNHAELKWKLGPVCVLEVLRNYIITVHYQWGRWSVSVSVGVYVCESETWGWNQLVVIAKQTAHHPCTRVQTHTCYYLHTHTEVCVALITDHFLIWKNNQANQSLFFIVWTWVGNDTFTGPEPESKQGCELCILKFTVIMKWLNKWTNCS